MAAIKLVALLCIAAFAASAPPPTPHVKDVISDLLVLLDQLKDVVQDAINSAVQTVTGLLDLVTAEVQKIVTDLTGSLDEVVQGLLQAIDNLIAEAAEAGVDVVECIGTSKEDIQALPEQFLLNTTNCLAGKVNEAKDKVNQTLSDILSIGDAIVDISNDISACQRQAIFVQPICAAEIVSEITGSLVSLPLKITGDVASITEYIAALIPTLKVCEAGVIVAVTKAGGDIVTGVAECVNGKLHP